VKNLFESRVMELDMAFSWWMDIHDDEGSGYQWTDLSFKVN
jgi:hypothetical protein